MEIESRPMSDLLRTEPHPTCDSCGAEGALLYKDLEDHLFGVKGKYSYRQCPNEMCGLIWQDPMMQAEDIVRAYENYYTHKAGLMVTKGVLFRRLARMPGRLFDAVFMRVCGIKQARLRMRYLEMKELSPGRLLEIGCGRGEKLSLFKDLGWDVLGQEIDSRAVEHARKSTGVDVLCGDLLSLGLDADQFDAIIINHVVEHVFDVAALFEECFRLLKIGGRLAVTTPNGESLGHRTFQKYWRGLEPPRHLRIFSTRSLKKILFDAGFGECKISTVAASPRGVFEASYQLREAGCSCAEKYPETEIYYKSLFLQYREWFLCQKQQPVGEELLATAVK